MKIPVVFVLFLAYAVPCMAQKESYGLVTYAAPRQWKKENTNNSVSWSTVNAANKSWCMITLYKSNISKGSVEADLESDWGILVTKDNNITAGPQKGKIIEADGWRYQSAGGKALFNGAEMMVLLTVISGYNTAISIVARTNHADYLKSIEDFNSSIELTTPNASGQQETNTVYNIPTNNSSSLQTNWDDGWVSITRENWTEVKKGNNKVLVHFPNNKADAYNSVLKDGLANAWNILVAPRYNNIRNLELKPIQSFESISFCEADATDKATGKQVHIVLFKKHYSNGNGRYLEFITDTKQDYELQFGAYHNDEFNWDKQASMQFRNKFAVNAKELTGKWSASDYASLSYYYVNSGGFAGATATSIAHEFTFLNGGNYQSDHAGASGVVGNQQFSRQVYKGKFILNSWNMQLTNRFKGQTEKFDCYFEAVKGGRILLLTDKHNTVYTLVRTRK
ncbi:MAG TPA: hypothetical protein VM488_06585 [Pseudobacter sp.]|nr:hypothetical protein [Pseudobacter sp.]